MGQGILTGAIGGAIFGGIGALHLGGFAEIAAHAAGGAASGAIGGALSGGNIGISAIIGGLSAGGAEWAGESSQLFKLTGNYMIDVVKQAALGGVIGGAASSAMGGSFVGGFENGALTSAIAYTANDWLHDFASILSPDYNDPKNFGANFWQSLVNHPPSIGGSITSFGYTASISTDGYSQWLSPTMFGASIDFQTETNVGGTGFQVYAGANEHLSIGTYPFSPGPWYGKPISVSVGDAVMSTPRGASIQIPNDRF